MKILIIDDDDDIRRIARLSLGRLGGHDVVDASAGAAGIEQARRDAPDVILLDVMMPVMDGPATLAALRADPATADVPVIFLTAKAMKAEVERLLGLGASGVLTKPFDPRTLSDELIQVLSSAGLRR